MLHVYNNANTFWQYGASWQNKNVSENKSGFICITVAEWLSNGFFYLTGVVSVRAAELNRWGCCFRAPICLLGSLALLISTHHSPPLLAHFAQLILSLECRMPADQMHQDTAAIICLLSLSSNDTISLPMVEQQWLVYHLEITSQFQRCLQMLTRYNSKQTKFARFSDFYAHITF